MANLASILLVIFIFIGWSSEALAQEASAESGAVSGLIREPRGFLKKRKLCRKYGICGGGFQGGQQGGYPGGYGGHGQIPPINIGIGQSQSSSNAGGGGFGNGYYPNNFQYNQGYPGGFNRPGYHGNGYGGYNQFNGNYPGAGGYPGTGGYQGAGGYPGVGGYQGTGGYPGAGGYTGFGGGRPGYGFNGGYFDENQDNKPNHEANEDNEHEDPENQYPDHHNDYNQGPNDNGPGFNEPEHNRDQSGSFRPGGDYAYSNAFAYAGRQNSKSSQ